MTYICWTILQEGNSSLYTEINTTAVCNKNGNWELDSQDMCSVYSGIRIAFTLEMQLWFITDM